MKKRYILGMKEVLKHTQAESLKLVLFAVNLERVDGEKGLDEMVQEIILRSR